MFPCFQIVLYAEKLRLMIPCFFEKFLHSSKIIVLLLVSFLYFGKLGQFSLYPDTLCGLYACLPEALWFNTPIPLAGDTSKRDGACLCVACVSLDECCLLYVFLLENNKISFCFVFISKHFNNKETFKTRGPKLIFLNFRKKEKIEL